MCIVIHVDCFSCVDWLVTLVVGSIKDIAAPLFGIYLSAGHGV